MRQSQRRPQSCIECTKSKVRCDKTVPCSRCSKRGLTCSREDVLVSLKKNRSGSKHSALHGSSRGSSVDHVLLTNVPLPATHAGRNTTSSINSDAGLLANSRPILEKARQVSRIKCVPKKRLSNAAERSEFEDLATGIEGLAWGRHQCHRYPHRSCLHIENVCDALNLGALEQTILEVFPSIEIARDLVHFHMKYLCWNHNVLHAPTFWTQCEAFWSSGIVENGQWLALYCAILTTASWSIQNRPDYVQSPEVVGFAHSTSRLFSLAVELLFKGNFMDHHTIFSLQAVCVSGMVANVLGKSDLLTTLVNTSVRIAQCLGLHRIPENEPGDIWDDIVEREVGRRVWWKLVEMDYYSMPYTGSACINPRHFTTRLPLNCDDHDLKERDESFMTTSTYSIIMARIALLIPDLLDGLYTIKDQTARYEHVIDIDHRMRQIATNVPASILRVSGDSMPQHLWSTLARRTLAIAAADKIIMIHRSFLVRSFQTPAYLFTRTTCTSAAITILREHEKILEANSGCPPIWLHSAFCVTAVVVICLHQLYCRATLSRDKRELYQTLIRKARSRLSLSNNDTMARRGVFLIDAMLDEDIIPGLPRDNCQQPGSGKPEFYRILERFRQKEQQQPNSEQSAPIDANAVGSSNGDLAEDFDVWYDQVFGRFMPGVGTMT